MGFLSALPLKIPFFEQKTPISAIGARKVIVLQYFFCSLTAQIDGEYLQLEIPYIAIWSKMFLMERAPKNTETGVV